MRSISECQAEVFRRSEMRIKARKKRRNNIRMACVPLVLCITIFSVVLVPAMMDKEFSGLNTSPENGSQGVIGTENNGLALLTGTVEVSGDEIYYRHTSAGNVQDIIGLLNGILATPEIQDEDIRDHAQRGGTESAAYEKKYTIIVTRRDGKKEVYLLFGKILIDQDTQKMFQINEKTVLELKKALGLSPH